MHIAGNAHKLRAYRVLCALGGIAAFLVQQQMGHQGEAFHILQAGGQGEDAADLDERRLHAGAPGLALDGAYKCCALAADIGTGAGVQLNIEIEAPAQDVGAQEAVVFRLADGV